MTGHGMTELRIVSTLDGSAEPSLFDHPGRGEPCPLLVGLHTWSADRFNQVQAMLPLTRERGWALLLPEFRGPNLRTNPRCAQACGSKLAMQDVIDAVEHVSRHHPIDTQRLFLLGGSGGGHMALMLAGHFPEQWTAVSSWCPITHLATWHGQNHNYAPHIAACCGGPPGRDTATDRQYHERSPCSQVAGISRTHVSLHHGRADRSVPWTHSWRLAQALIEQQAQQFYFELFDGGHEIHHERALRAFDALAQQTVDGPALTG